jgi:hypothetical protein
VWHNATIFFEIYDLDICFGLGNYHRKCWLLVTFNCIVVFDCICSIVDHPCLATAINDTGTVHSPIYGWATDGYPIFGPYQANGTLVEKQGIIPLLRQQGVLLDQGHAF